LASVQEEQQASFVVSPKTETIYEEIMIQKESKTQPNIINELALVKSKTPFSGPKPIRLPSLQCPMQRIAQHGVKSNLKD